MSLQELRLIKFFKSRPNSDKKGSNCLDEGQIAAYADQNLTGSERERAEIHLADCDYCSDQLGYLIHTQKTPVPEMAPAALLHEARNLTTARARARESGLWFWGKMAAAAAAACLAVVVAVSFRHPQPGPAPAPGKPSVVTSTPAPARIPEPAQTAQVEHPPAVRGGTEAPIALKLVQPAAGAVLPANEIKFRWQPVPGARDYEVQLLTAAGDLVWSQNVATNSMSVPADVKVDVGAKYFVRVQANLAGGKSVRSTPIGFTAAKEGK